MPQLNETTLNLGQAFAGRDDLPAHAGLLVRPGCGKPVRIAFERIAALDHLNP